MQKKKQNISEHKTCETSVNVSVKEAGRRGGCATLERRGVEFYRQIGRKGGQQTAELYAEVLSEFGKKGGRPKRPHVQGVGGKDL